MKLVIVAIRDVKADAYGPPGFTQSIPVAIRSFTDDVNGRDPMCTKHFADMELYEFGEFESNTGVFTIHPPVCVITGSSVKEQTAPQGQLQLVK